MYFFLSRFAGGIVLLCGVVAGIFLGAADSRCSPLYIKRDGEIPERIGC